MFLNEWSLRILDKLFTLIYQVLSVLHARTMNTIN